ncbi:MAG: Uncharacterized short protein YbdD, DUF466 family [Candidatus Nitrotoga sp. SPKER]|nr:MAG: Uncharacterized short protein YbdD, DUF466 family [Candidatus Nitrotoga sp. SPKER]
METRLITKSANELLPAVSDSSLPVFETAQDVSRHIAQSITLNTNTIHIDPLPLLIYVWRTIRELSGDDAYERYITQHTTNYPDTPPLTRKDFFLCQQQQKWRGIQRCC